MKLKKNIKKKIICIINKLPAYFTIKIIQLPFLRNRLVFDFDRTFAHNFPISTYFKFIQIGGNDGVSFDTLYENLCKRNPKGIILEPSPKYFKKLEQNYSDFSNIVLLNKAIHPNESKFTLYEVNENGLDKLPEWGQGIGTFNIDNLICKNLKNSDISIIEVDCVSFNELISQFSNFLKIDFLQIDTEGFDGEIIKSIDFSQFYSKMIKFENCILPNGELEIVKNLLFKNNYIVFDDIDNSIAINKQKVAFFK